ncbi:hypothetical protein HK102_010291, partial [Quaeritorhiza haematococci]
GQVEPHRARAGERPSAHQEVRGRPGRRPQEAGLRRQDGRDRPLGPPPARLPQPGPQADGLEEPAELQPGRRPAVRRPPLLSPHRAEIAEQVPDRRGRPVGVDGRRDGPVRHPGLDLRDPAARGGVAGRLRHQRDRPDPLGRRPVRIVDADRPGGRQRRPEGHAPRPRPDRRPPADDHGLDLGLLRVPQRPAAVRDDQGREAVGRPLRPGRLGQRPGLLQRQRVVPQATQGDRPAGPHRQHQEAHRRAEEAAQL